VLREMSEELSEMDEEELQGLRGKGFDEEGIVGVDNAVDTPPAAAKTGGSLKKNGKKKRRWPGFK
jgi:hypothetical protein